MASGDQDMNILLSNLRESTDSQQALNALKAIMSSEYVSRPQGIPVINQEIVQGLDNCLINNPRLREMVILAQMDTLPETLENIETYVNFSTNSGRRIEEHIRNGNLAEITTEIQQGTDPNPYLWFAVSFGNCETLNHLLRNGADPNYVNDAGSTAIFYAITQDQEDKVFALLEGGARVDSISIESNSTPIQWAASSGSPRSAALLLARGADPLQEDELGRNSLEIASSVLRREIDRLSADFWVMKYLQPFQDTVQVIRDFLSNQHAFVSQNITQR